jgi:hypothetical protein
MAGRLPRVRWPGRLAAPAVLSAAPSARFAAVQKSTGNANVADVRILA